MKIIGDEVLRIQNGDAEFDIVSPWSGSHVPLSITRIMNGNWIYCGSFSEDKDLFIDFVTLHDLTNFVRWRVSDQGRYVTRLHLDAAELAIFARPPVYTHTNKLDFIVEKAQTASNDFQIYSFLKYVFSNAEMAQAYLDGFSPKTFLPVVAPPIPLHTILIFNHNYARNIIHLERIFSGRVSSLIYVLPNASPNSDRCISVPAGSYSYHYMIHAAISRLMANGDIDADAWYLFSQDDVYLNMSFDAFQMPRFFDGLENASAAFFMDPTEGGWDFTSEWCWNDRILTALENQRAVLGGNGFEGYAAFFRKEHLVNGVSDIFFVKGRFLSLFSDILAHYISQHVFPEVAIPSALKVLAARTATSVARCKGQFLWGEDRKKANLEYLKAFDTSDQLFLHPVKSSLLAKIGSP
jgi:hypothetical protein